MEEAEIVEEPKNTYNGLRYLVISSAVYKKAMPAPLKDNYPMYKLDEDGNPVQGTDGNPTLLGTYTWKQVNEADQSQMWCFPKQVIVNKLEVTVWVGKETKELLWADEDVVAIDTIGKSYDHEGILAYLEINQVKVEL